MFTKRIDLFRLLGFRISLDASWFLLAILVVWTLTAGYFPALLPDQSFQVYLWMGIAGAVGLFVSIVLHEFAHAMVARYYDVPIAGITLFIFGGIAEMSDEPESAGVEFQVAIAGPIASILIAAACYLLETGVFAGLDLARISAVIHYLAVINLVLAVFNMLPAFPLDGGRVLRAGLWWWQGSIRKATRIASYIGVALASVIMGIGVVTIVSGAFIAGMWHLLIGFFIYNAAGASRVQLALRTMLKDLPVKRITNTTPVTVDPDMTVQTLVEDYFYRHHHKFFPVVENGEIAGCITVKQIGDIDRGEWPSVRVRDVMAACGEKNVLDAREDAFAVLRKMQGSSSHHYLVVEDGKFLGLVTMKDLMSYLAIRLELEEEDEAVKSAVSRSAGAEAAGT